MCIAPILGVKIGNQLKMVKKEWQKKILWNNNDKNIFLIKCGNCKECRKQKMLTIIDRIKKEASFWENNTIATLTYNEENKKELNVQDMQKFLKRMRNNGYNIRYFYAGELGEKTKRPHYHIIIFNYYPKDSKFYKYTKNNRPQYISKELNKIWGLGITTHEKLTKQAINYIVKYMMKDYKKTKEAIYKWSKIPPLGINEKNIKQLKEQLIKNRYMPKCFFKYYERKTNEKIQITEEQQKQIDEEQQEKIKYIEKITGIPYKKYLTKRTQALYNQTNITNKTKK